MTSPPVTVVVLAGGRSARYGSDKLAAPLRGTTVLDHLLDGLPGPWPVLAVGPPRDTRRAVTWTVEDPPGAGPLAAVLAGAARAGTDLVAVVAGDMPHAGAALTLLVDALASAGPQVDAAVAVDDAGVANPLLAAYRTAALRARATAPAAGGAARALLALTHVEVPLRGPATGDVDTPGDLLALQDDATRRGHDAGPGRR